MQGLFIDKIFNIVRKDSKRRLTSQLIYKALSVSLYKQVWKLNCSRWSCSTSLRLLCVVGWKWFISLFMFSLINCCCIICLRMAHQHLCYISGKRTIKFSVWAILNLLLTQRTYWPQYSCHWLDKSKNLLSRLVSHDHYCIIIFISYLAYTYNRWALALVYRVDPTALNWLSSLA